MNKKQLPNGLPFTQLPNHILEDASLSDSAYRLLSYIWGRPAHWTFWRGKICGDLGMTRYQYQRSMVELEARQYCKRVYFYARRRKQLSFVILPKFYMARKSSQLTTLRGTPISVPWMAPVGHDWRIPWRTPVVDPHDPLLRAVGGSAHQ